MLIKSNVRNLDGINMGKGYFPVIFAHVGLGEKNNLENDLEEELNKVDEAVKAGADIICDVSMHKNIELIQQSIIKHTGALVGGVSIYEAYINLEYDKDLVVDSSYFLTLFERQCARGLDVVTIHATIFKDDRSLMQKSQRLIPSTSRGGILVLEIMEKYDLDNPYYLFFDEILNIAKKYHTSISLAPTFRPASVYDAKLKDLHLLELRRMSKLCKKALKQGVNIMIEGIGHAPLNMIKPLVKKAIKICHNVPYRVMSVATDIAIGYDHIASSIASSEAVYAGASSITAVTRMEHLGIPNTMDVVEGVKCAKIAAYIGYTARTKDFSRDVKMSTSRKKEGCVGDIDAALYKDAIINYYQNKKGFCTMCGSYCPLKKERLL